MKKGRTNDFLLFWLNIFYKLLFTDNIQRFSTGVIIFVNREMQFCEAKHVIYTVYPDNEKINKITLSRESLFKHFKNNYKLYLQSFDI